ncbi:MAG: translation elongation factor Ts [candidate division WOR-3 bacterium]
MEIPLEKIKELRQRTGAGILECKTALLETNCDVEKAIELLRKKGIARAEKKLERPTAEGVVDAYIHPGEKLGVLLEVNCESDFVARNQEFRKFVHELAMQIAATDPMAISPEDLPKEVLERERRIYESQIADSKKPPAVIEKIISGKLAKFYEDVCLLEQPYIKNPEMKVKDFVKEHIAKFGENIKIRRFVRFKIGE